MNVWKVTYDLQGLVREAQLSALNVPSTEAIAFAVYSDAFPGKPPPDEAGSIDDWLFCAGIVVLSVTLLQ
ncbi:MULTISPECIES: hypothetical protein [Pseudomonas]|uniref:hypothetical protein n=1 Tax=Pseudomonas TaxID=286 RepID=UPI0011B70C67|nr:MULTISPECIES: hypothetical protein [Pseudomonas]